MMNSSESGPMNLGNPETHTLTEVAEYIIKLTNSRSTISHKPHLPYTAKQGVPNIRLAKEKLGWFPVVPLEDGLQKTVEYMRGSGALTLDSFSKR